MRPHQPTTLLLARRLELIDFGEESPPSAIGIQQFPFRLRSLDNLSRLADQGRPDSDITFPTEGDEEWPSCEAI
jgi:hypothetical protein